MQLDDYAVSLISRATHRAFDRFRFLTPLLSFAQIWIYPCLPYADVYR